MLSWSNWNTCSEGWRSSSASLILVVEVVWGSSEGESESFVFESVLYDCSFFGALPRFLCCRAYSQSY